MVTRLGEDVDATGRLGDAPQARVFEVLEQYARAIAERGAQRSVAVLTSAVRDAANGAEFAAAVRDRFGLDARTLSGDEEARLTYLGATAARDAAAGERLLVIDIGGGSTELVIGEAGEVRFHVSTQIGVVRHSERHLRSDPPTADELSALEAEVEHAIDAAVPAAERERVTAAVAVAGTATQSAGIDWGRRTRGRGPPALVRAVARHIRSTDRASPRTAPRAARTGPGSGADHRGGRPGVDSCFAVVRARRGRGLRARHPLGAAGETGRSTTSN